MSELRIQKLQQFLKESPKDEFLNYALAQEYISLGNDDEAKIIFQNLIEYNPDYVATYYHLAKIFERKKEKEKAIEIYELGILACKKNRDLHALSELQTAKLNLEFDD